jgi:hypothetical protein
MLNQMFLARARRSVAYISMAVHPRKINIPSWHKPGISRRLVRARRMTAFYAIVMAGDDTSELAKYDQFAAPKKRRTGAKRGTKAFFKNLNI